MFVGTLLSRALTGLLALLPLAATAQTLPPAALAALRGPGDQQ